MKTRLYEAALVLGSLGAAILLAEVFLLTTDPGPNAIAREIEVRRMHAAREAGRPFDSRTRLEVLRDLRARGIDAVPLLGAHSRYWISAAGPERRSLPILGGVSKTTTIFCNEPGQYETYVADEHGYHNPRGLHGRAPLQVAIIGDSFAQGMCVPREASIAGRVRAAFPATLNLGLSETGPLHQLATFREYAAHLRPRFVVWHWFEGNDLPDLRRELTRAHARDYLTTNAPFGLRYRQAEVDGVLRTVIDARMREETSGRSGFRSLAEVLLLRGLRRRLGMAASLVTGDERQATDEELLAVTERILATVRDTARQWGGDLVMVYLPDSTRYCDAIPAWGEYCALDSTQDWRGLLHHRDDVLAIFTRLGLPVVDGHAAFVRVGRPADMFYFAGSHYSPEGYRVIAEAILRKIEERHPASRPTSPSAASEFD